MRVFSLNDIRVENVRREFGLSKAKLIGSGTFACVFDDGDPDSVIKLTADECSYMYLADGTAPNKAHAPIVLEDQGNVGETRLGLPLYLARVERLNRLQPGSPAKKLARKLVKHYASELKRHVTTRFSAAYFEHLPIPDSVRKFLGEFEQFISNAGGGADFHSTNFMERADGTLVFNDPVANFELINSYRRQIRREQEARHRY